MRLIPLENAHNFRDLGGYPVKGGGSTRSGILFRSDTVSRLSEKDCETVRGLDIRTVFDLRRADEQIQEGADDLGDGITIIHMPTGLGVRKFFRDAGSTEPEFTMGDFYIGNLAERAAYHAELFRKLGDPALQPAVFHCSAGKDRTGIMAALLLRIAGVPDEHIVADYVETADNMRDAFEKQLALYRKTGLSNKAIDELFSCEPESMERLLDHIDRTYGTVEEYLIGGGTSPEEIDRFKAGFVQLDSA